MTIYRFIRYGAPPPSMSASTFVALALLLAWTTLAVAIGNYVMWP